MTTSSPAACAKPACERRGLAEVAAQADDAHVVAARVQTRQRAERSVGRAVVDVHGLPRARRAGRARPGAPRTGARRCAPRCGRGRRPRSRPPSMRSLDGDACSRSRRRLRRDPRRVRPLPAETRSRSPQRRRPRARADATRRAVDLPPFPSSAMDRVCRPRRRYTPGRLPMRLDRHRGGSPCATRALASR